jgi:phage terminase large subunit GpA-like protein
MHQDPSSILVVQPTVDDAKNFSKETIAPMLRDVPVLAADRVPRHRGKGRARRARQRCSTRRSRAAFSR